MASSLEQCLSRIGFYQNVPRLRRDMQTLLYNCSTLKPNVNVFQSSSGNITLFYLTGVIPISYQGASYNIPVSIYLDPPYPSQPPRVFVTPTPEMSIKTNHKTVDMNGRVYLPQLSQWNSHSSSLVDIVAVLSSIFSSEPPVVSKRPAAVPLVGTVVTRSGGSLPRKEILLKSLTVKIRARLPVVLKTQVEGINEGKKVELRFVEKAALLSQMSLESATLAKRVEFSMAKLATLEASTDDWVRLNKNAGCSALAFLKASTVVGEQVLDLAAEEAALEDLIDYMSQLARDGKISTPELFRETRGLTRKLFETKFLARKALVVMQAY